MWDIKILPQHIINKLKAWEIVERPSSIVKELIENSLDAWADEIILEISDWWKSLIRVEDNWVWIHQKDLWMSIEHHATSKILDENDLYNISTYWFRWEALASISEVCKFRIQSKISESKVANELIKIWKDVNINQIAFAKDHGTIIFIEDLFINIPARQKFLKSSQTEWTYIYDIFLDFALLNYDKKFTIIRDFKTFMILEPCNDLLDRIISIYKKEWQKNFKILEQWDEKLHLYGVISDSLLTYNSMNNIKFFVNKRPVQDKIMKKSVMDAYNRQLPHGEYPFVLLFLDIDPSMVDVNVHPRKIEVKFIDPWSIFNFVNNSIKSCFGVNKISWVDIGALESGIGWGSWSSAFWGFKKDLLWTYNNKKEEFLGSLSWDNKQWFVQQNLDLWYKHNIFWDSKQLNITIQTHWYDFRIIWQIWDSYILLETQNGIFIADQHAIAERILFEKLRKQTKQSWLRKEIIMNPITISVSKNIELEEKLENLNWLWFDVSEFGENKLVVYAVPKVFVEYKIDIELLIDKIIPMDHISLDILLDEILATKACKSSIKAWQKLSIEEMQRLIKDWFENIPDAFVCQHGRPSFVKIDKSDIEKLFDR